MVRPTSVLSQSRACDSRAYHPHHHHHHRPAHRPPAQEAGRLLLLARLDQHYAAGGGGRDHRLGQDSPLLLPKEAWTELGGPCDPDGEQEEDCWSSPTVRSLTGQPRPAADVGTVDGGRSGLWLLSSGNSGVDRRLGPLPPPHRPGGGGTNRAETASPSSPSDVTTTSTTSSETYASKSTGSSASSSRSCNRGRSRP
jgi:hypothetical protein